MKHELNKALLLIVGVIIVLIAYSCNCKDKEEDDGGDNDDLYFVTTNSMVNNYFSPKKLNLYVDDKYKQIVGDWFANEYITADTLDGDDKIDHAGEYAVHYYFLDHAGIRKYIDLKNKYDGKKVQIDNEDIEKPYKDYASIYGDTICIEDHTGSDMYYGIQACVMPLIGIDIVSNKDFDSSHPAGTLLNDITLLQWWLHPFIYETLHEMDENSTPRFYGKTGYEFMQAAYEQQKEPIRVNTLPEKPLQMMGRKYYLEFDHAPATPGAYEFTIKFTFGPDPLSGETVDIEPVTVSMVF